MLWAECLLITKLLLIINQPIQKVAAPKCLSPVYQQTQLIYVYEMVLVSLKHKCQRNIPVRFFFKGLDAKEKNQTIFHPVDIEALTQSDKSQHLCAQHIYH